jgi:hypothetical protein
LRRLHEQDLDRFERVGLVQRRERDQAFELGKDRSIHAHGCRVFAAAVDDAMRYRDRKPPMRLRLDGCAHILQRGVVGLVRSQYERNRRRTALDQLRLAADAVDLAGPQRLARQRLAVAVEERELDAR